MATLISTDLKMVLIIKTYPSSLKLYIPFLLVATKCNKTDYWFEKQRMRGPNFCLTYKHNYKKFTHLNTPMLPMNKNQWIVTNYEYSNE